MKKRTFHFLIASILITSISLQTATAQSWNITGNNNATSASKLGTTNLVPLRFFTSDKQRMIIDSLGRVGINTNNPVNILTVKSSGGIPAPSWLNGLNKPVFIGFADAMSSEHVLSAASNVSVERAVFQGRRSRGSLVTPLAVANNDYITSLLASAYDGTTFQNPALVSFFVDSTPYAGNVPARISFVTGSNTGNRKERLKVGSTGNFDFNNGQIYLQQSNGSVGIGTSIPDASSLLEVKSTTKGFLTPRMTQAQRDAIVSPAIGLLIYQTNNTPGFYYYTGSTWTAVKSNSSSGGGWSLTGNAGTTPGTNFIGTTDAQSLVFKVNNQRAGLIDYSTCCSGTRNTAFGQVALNSLTSGADNTATGYGALYTNTTGNQNVAYGKYALYNSNANDNTAYGFNAMFFNETGAGNTAIGIAALQNNTSGSNNVAVGNYALGNNFTGSNNTAIGVAAQVGAPGLTNATAIGANAIVSVSNAIVLGNNANVGIGTTSPGYRLDVVGRMRMQSGGGTAGSFLMNSNNSTEAAFIGMLNDNYVGLYGSNGASWGLLMNTTSGNVGVGTSSPAAKLHIRVSGLDAYQGLAITNANAGGKTLTINQGGLGKLNFTNPGVVDLMTLDFNNQNVGIGTTAPGYKLDVCGTIRAKELRVESGWCDYVFEKNYKLKSIEELEQFINENKHLPGIAPASEVEREGLKVAEMNKAMMEKIEELTLYVIQLSKENKKLQNEIESLKK